MIFLFRLWSCLLSTSVGCQPFVCISVRSHLWCLDEPWLLIMRLAEATLWEIWWWVCPAILDYRWWLCWGRCRHFNSEWREIFLSLTHWGRGNLPHFADFQMHFFNENVWIQIKISLKFVLKGPINNIPALVQIMAWCRPGAKPLSEAMMVRLPTHICITRPQCVNSLAPGKCCCNPKILIFKIILRIICRIVRVSW